LLHILYFKEYKIKMKKIITAILSFICTILFFVQISCTTQKPWQYKNVVWYSVEPEIEIIKDENYDWEGHLIVNNEEISIILLWGPTNTFEIIDASKYNEQTPVDEITLLSGKVEYDKSKVTLIISIDFVFNSRYSKIILYRKDYTK